MCFSSLKRCQSCANTQILEQEIGAPSPKLALCSRGPCKYPRAEAHPIDREQVGKFEQGRSSTCRVTGYVDLRVSNIVSVREEHDSRSAIISWLNCRCLSGVGYYDAAISLAPIVRLDQHNRDAEREICDLCHTGMWYITGGWGSNVHATSHSSCFAKYKQFNPFTQDAAQKSQTILVCFFLCFFCFIFLKKKKRYIRIS